MRCVLNRVKKVWVVLLLCVSSCVLFVLWLRWCGGVRFVLFVFVCMKVSRFGMFICVCIGWVSYSVGLWIM